MDERRCSKCGTCKLPTEFGKHPSYCSACSRAAAAAWRQANPDKLKAQYQQRTAQRSAVRAQRRAQLAEERDAAQPPAVAVCRVCGVEQPLEHFAIDRRARWGRERRCRICKATETRRYLSADPKRREAASRTAAAHNAKYPAKRASYVRARRALLQRAAVVPFTAEQLEQRMSMWGHRCWMCGGVFEHVDHVKPLSKGGMHCLANLRPACAPCNTRKQAKWPLT